jgi:glyoxylase-like metal-dependent hydrolase (beta-lactamase superfamily II)
VYSIDPATRFPSYLPIGNWNTDRSDAVMSDVEILRLNVGELGTNCYVLTCTRTGAQSIIDPGGDLPRITSALRSPEHVLLTHCHFDHTGAVQGLKDTYDIPCYCGEKEPCEFCDLRVKEDDVVVFGELSLKVLQTPGHTQGGISYRLDDLLFCGDTIFLGAIGATHYPGGDFDTLIRTITEKIFALPENTVLLPGHGPETTVGREKRSGFYPTL